MNALCTLVSRMCVCKNVGVYMRRTKLEVHAPFIYFFLYMRTQLAEKKKPPDEAHNFFVPKNFSQNFCLRLFYFTQSKSGKYQGARASASSEKQLGLTGSDKMRKICHPFGSVP